MTLILPISKNEFTEDKKTTRTGVAINRTQCRSGFGRLGPDGVCGGRQDMCPESLMRAEEPDKCMAGNFDGHDTPFCPGCYDYSSMSLQSELEIAAKIAATNFLHEHSCFEARTQSEAVENMHIIVLKGNF